MKKLMTMLISLLALCACSNDLDNPEPNPNPDPSPAPAPVPPVARRDIPLTDTQKLMASKNTGFAYHLFAEVSKSYPQPSNVIISPQSVNYALSMLNNGADGETKKEIMKVLGYDGFTDYDVIEYNQKMLYCSSRLDPEASLVAANSIWLREGLPVLPEFNKINKEAYASEVYPVDFAAPKTLQLINAWASHYTEGSIPTVLDKINPQAALYLLNAVSFKGRWDITFSKSATQPGTFNNADGTTTTVPMMYRSFNSVCMVGDKYNLLPLPYGNSAFSFYILLPVKGETTASVIAGLSEESWVNMFKNRAGYNVRLKLPRFNTNCNTNLCDILKVLGMPSAFDAAKADFSRLSTQAICISDAFQKSAIEVDEEGTKASSVTVVETMYTSAGPMELPEIDFFVDRPFVYMIRETSTGAIFFMGEMNQIK